MTALEDPAPRRRGRSDSKTSTRGLHNLIAAAFRNLHQCSFPSVGEEDLFMSWYRGCLSPTCCYEDDSHLGVLLGFRWLGVPSGALHHGCRISQEQLHFLCEEWTPRLSRWRKLRGKEELHPRSRWSSRPGECERMWLQLMPRLHGCSIFSGLGAPSCLGWQASWSLPFSGRRCFCKYLM